MSGPPVLFSFQCNRSGESEKSDIDLSGIAIFLARVWTSGFVSASFTPNPALELDEHPLLATYRGANSVQFLSHAIKMIGTLFSSRLPLPGASTKIASGLCYQAGEGRDVALLCHVGSYEMPAFVAVAALLILLFFGFAVVKLAYKCNTRASLFDAISDALRGSSGRERSLSEIKELFRSAARGDDSLLGCWRHLEQAIVTIPGSKTPLLSRPIEDFFQQKSLVDVEVDISFIATVPAILTGCGLLMTFVAILDGLSHVSVSSTMDVVGIPGLINGLSGKFISSIVAVGCAVAFAAVERAYLGRLERASRRLIDVLGGAFSKYTTEQILVSIHGRLEQQLAIQSEQIELLKKLGAGGDERTRIQAK